MMVLRKYLLERMYMHIEWCEDDVKRLEVIVGICKGCDNTVLYTRAESKGFFGSGEE